jgi:hypothetical protein
MENSNKRIHTRAQFFFVRREDKYVPVFAFRPADDPAAIAALVVDLNVKERRIQANETLASPSHQ